MPWRIQRRIPLTGIRGAAARRLRESLATAVPLTLTREVRADALVAARGRLRERLGAAPWDALFVKLFADALREHPALNAVVAGDEILVLDDVHVGFAVPVNDGLVVPVVHDADRRPLAEVAAAVRELGERARAGKSSPADLLGGTATVSNLGAHGVDAFTPILNPPQSAILGIGRIALRPTVEQGPAVEEGRLVAAPTCVLSLTFDHRVADGAPAAVLLGGGGGANGRRGLPRRTRRRRVGQRGGVSMTAELDPAQPLDAPAAPRLDPRELAYRIRRHCVLMTSRANASHIGSSLSMADLLAVLYARFLRFDPARPEWPERDRFILSKGHGCAALYAVLAECGYFPVGAARHLLRGRLAARRPRHAQGRAGRRGLDRLARPRPAARRRHGAGGQARRARRALLGDGLRRRVRRGLDLGGGALRAAPPPRQPRR